MTSHPLPSGGGAFIREKDGTLRRVEEDPAPEVVQAAVEAPVETPVEEAVKAPAKRPAKEA